MAFRDLRRSVKSEIFDYPTLMHHLREYKKPRDKVTLLLKNQSILRIKKGLYIFGPDYQKKGVSKEILANLIYSPSYISLQYALAKYGFIPERAYVITSVCLNRSRTFKTPIGAFTYKTRSISTYSIGIERIEVSDEGSYLIATPEKALVDLISQIKKINQIQEMREYLYEDMRMEPSNLKKLNRVRLDEIVRLCGIGNLWVKAICD